MLNKDFRKTKVEKAEQESNCISYEKATNDIKEGAYYCYCAYVLRISRYSDFLLLVLTNTAIFLRGSKLCGESST